MNNKKQYDNLMKWSTHEFSSGAYTGEDYLAFQKDYLKFLKATLPGVTVKMGKSHYEFSAVLSKEINGRVRYVYLAISDVRFFPNEWYNHILVRTMAHDKDWTGGMNNYCTLQGVCAAVEHLFGLA